MNYAMMMMIILMSRSGVIQKEASSVSSIPHHVHGDGALWLLLYTLHSSSSSSSSEGK